MTDSLLPNNATPFELALSETSAARHPFPHDLIKQLWQPWKVQAAVLPYLANSLSVDLWYDDWSEDRKRKITADAFNLHRLKGRVEGVRQHLLYVDAKLLKATTPPSKTYLMPKLTDAERASYLARFAQLRVRRYAEGGTFKYGTFTNFAFGFNGAFLGHMHCYHLGAADRYRSKAFLLDKGVETPLTLRSVVKEDDVTGEKAIVTDEVILPPTGEHKEYVGNFVGNMFFGNEADTELLLMSIPRSVPFWRPRELYTTTPVGEFIRVEPEYVQEKHTAQKGTVFAGQFLSGGFLPKTDAWFFIYERWYIHDSARVPDARKRSTHLGFTRLNMPGYWAEYKVEVRGKRYAREVSRFVNGFLQETRREPLNRALYAVKTASAFRDKPLVNTKTVRVIELGDRQRVGQVKLGQLIKV